MTNRNIKFTKTSLENIKHTEQLQKYYDKSCEGLACFIHPEPSLNKSYYAHWSTVTYDAAGKQKRSGRYKRICRVGQKPLDEVKAEVITKLKIWKAGFDEHKQNVEKKYITEKKYISENLEKERESLYIENAQIEFIKQDRVNKKMNKMNLSEKKKLPAFISAHHACELIYKINEKTFILEYGG